MYIIKRIRKEYGIGRCVLMEGSKKKRKEKGEELD